MSINKLSLVNYRNHKLLDINLGAKCISIIGNNGSGKTNILEAISFLAPGRGMHKSRLDMITNFENADQGWGIMAKCESDGDTNDIKTTYAGQKRILKLNETFLRDGMEVLEHLRVIWLMPTMDNILAEAPSIKRKFLDRICYNFFPHHANNSLNYDKAMRQRNMLLQNQCMDDAWLSSLEHLMAEEAFKIIDTRAKSLKIISDSFLEFTTSFLKVNLGIEGKTETIVEGKGCDEAVRDIKMVLKQSRFSDTKAKRTLFGVHRSELVATHSIKNTNAKYCSTGELKAMLISLVLAQCFSIRKAFKGSVVLLLDDILSHLDEDMRINLLTEINRLDVQTIITSTEEPKEFFLCKESIKIEL